MLLLVIGGIVDFGRAFFTQIEITNGAREGARAAIVSSASLDDIRARALAFLPPDQQTGFSANQTMTCPGTNASVTVSTDFEWILLAPAMSLFGAGDVLPKTLSSTAVMQCGG